MIYCTSASPCEYAMYPVVSGTDPEIRKEMDDYFNSKVKLDVVGKSESLFKKAVNYVFTK